MDLGWIKIHRQIIDWEWYDEPNTFRVFLHLLLKANHKPRNYRGVTIEAGQIMTGLDLLSRETSLSIQKVRTSLNRLKSTNEITIKSSTKGTIIQVVNYGKYQVATDKQQTTNKQLTNEQQTTNKQLTTNKNVNNIKNEKNEKNKEFDLFWDLYDKKKGSKAKCESKFNSLSKETKEKIFKTLPHFLKSIKDKQFLPFPSTYLNNERWNDELESQVKKVYSVNNY
jgi:translation initiation factor IF-3